MKKNNSYNILILSILASFLILLNSCSSRGKIWDPADAREFPAEPEKRVQKNLEEGRGFRIMDLNKKKVADHLNLILQMLYGEQH